MAPGRPSQPQFSSQPQYRQSISGTNLADMGMSSVQRSSFQNSSTRRSYAPAATSRPSVEERRSSVYRSRGSSNGPVHQSFFQQAPQSAGIPEDPRPLRNGGYQTKIGQELLDYMAANNFEMEMKHMLTQTTIKSPTQKDFVMMFQWLYKRIDPNYRFQKSIDQEVPPILAQLRYPYQKKITKSSLSAVGSANSWYIFLGLLHWMMQLAQMLDGYAGGRYDDACAEAGVDVNADRIIFGFLSVAYRDWLSMDDETTEEESNRILAPHIEAMADEFNQSNSKYVDELHILEAEHKRLQKEIAALEVSGSQATTLDSHFKLMTEDIVKFNEFYNHIVQKNEKYEARVKGLQEQLDELTLELKEAEEERANLQKAVDDSGQSMADIDRWNAAKEQLQKNLESTNVRLEESKRKVSENESEASQRLDDLERAVERYNSLGYQIGLIPSTAPNAKGKNYELEIIVNEGPDFSASQMASSGRKSDSDRLLADPVTGYQPAHILNLDIRGQVKNNFTILRKEISERRSAAMEEMMKYHDLLDNIKEAIEEKRGEVGALEHRVRAAEDEYEKTKEVTSTQKLASDAQIEKMEKELAKMRAGLTDSVLLMEERDMNTNIEYVFLFFLSSFLLFFLLLFLVGRATRLI